jgi:bacterioferritin
MLRYRRHHFVARGLRAKAAADEFLEHAHEELDHADRIAARIAQLGGDPDLRPDTLAERSHARYVPGESLEQMITENLVAERIAIETYRAAIRAIGDRDPTTRRLFESILEVEEEHAEDLVGLLPG